MGTGGEVCPLGIGSAISLCKNDGPQLRDVQKVVDVAHSSPPAFHAAIAPWKKWSEVPTHPGPQHRSSKFFLEVFADKAHLSRAMRRIGWLVLPPVYIELSEEVSEEGNVLNEEFLQKLKNWCSSGVVLMVHFGTPCTTFSIARRDDGGPPPLRSEQFLLGLSGLSELNAEKVRLGNLFLDITIDLVLCVASVLCGRC